MSKRWSASKLSNFMPADEAEQGSERRNVFPYASKHNFLNASTTIEHNHGGHDYK